MNKLEANRYNTETFCPLCKSADIKDISIWDSNKIFGPDSVAWKTLDIRKCLSCGILFSPINQEDNELLPCGYRDCIRPHEKVYNGCDKCKLNQKDKP